MAEEKAREESKDNLKFFKKAKASTEEAVQVEDAPQEAQEPEAASQPAEVGEEEKVEAQKVVEPPKEPSVPLKVLLAPTIALAIRTLVILAIIVADAFAAYYLVARALAPRLLEARVVNAMRQAEEPAAPAEQPTETAQPPTVGTITPIEDVVVNPSGTSGTRYLCTTVALEAVDPTVVEEIQGREPQIRDLLIEILGRRTVEELSDLQTRENLREEIKTAVDDLLVSGEITGVYFANFVLQ